MKPHPFKRRQRRKLLRIQLDEDRVFLRLWKKQAPLLIKIRPWLKPPRPNPMLLLLRKARETPPSPTFRSPLPRLPASPSRI